MMTARALSVHWQLHDLLSGIADILPENNPAIQSLALDSRDLQPGALFIALRGARSDAVRFAEAAIAAGAVAIVHEGAAGIALRQGVPLIGMPDLRQKAGLIAARYFGEPSRQMQMIGITGTNGKTSCSHFLAQCLAQDAPCGLIGTLGYGLYGQLTAGRHTTPDAITVHALLADFAARHAGSAVMEVSSHGLEQGRVAGVQFTAGIFTNLSRDHLDYHGDMQRYGAAKRLLFGTPGLAAAVINADDAFGRELLANPVAGVAQVSYGLSGDAAVIVRGSGLKLGPHGLSLQVSSPWGQGMIDTPLVGRFNASNVLAVFAALMVLDVPFDVARERLAQLRSVPGRMERFGGVDGLPAVVVDYAHTPDALEKVLHSLRDVLTADRRNGHLWCVFGCGGDRDRGKRPLMGEIAQRLADRVIITDDNPRSEAGDHIIAEIMAGMASRADVLVQRDRGRAIAAAINQAGASDIVLIAGKGHEDYQQVGERRWPFDDREQARVYLAARRGGVRS